VGHATEKLPVPPNIAARGLWHLYTGVGLPVLGRLVSPGWAEVGRYLRPSITAFDEVYPPAALRRLLIEAGAAGVPMVALPMHAEQPANAQRLFELGVGLAVRPEKANAATLASACRCVLDDPALRRAARGFQRQILGLPGIDQLVADLTALTEKHSCQQRAKRR
jgi:hypothetical protein